MSVSADKLSQHRWNTANHCIFLSGNVKYPPPNNEVFYYFNQKRINVKSISKKLAHKKNKNSYYPHPLR